MSILVLHGLPLSQLGTPEPEIDDPFCGRQIGADRGRIATDARAGPQGRPSHPEAPLIDPVRRAGGWRLRSSIDPGPCKPAGVALCPALDRRPAHVA
jgi:3-dehydroquinate dehydratase